MSSGSDEICFNFGILWATPHKAGPPVTVSLSRPSFMEPIMKTYEIFGPDASSTSHVPVHTIKADSLVIRDGVYVFLDKDKAILHAVATVPGLFVRTVEK